MKVFICLILLILSSCTVKEPIKPTKQEFLTVKDTKGVKHLHFDNDVESFIDKLIVLLVSNKYDIIEDYSVCVGINEINQIPTQQDAIDLAKKLNSDLMLSAYLINSTGRLKKDFINGELVTKFEHLKGMNCHQVIFLKAIN